MVGLTMMREPVFFNHDTMVATQSNVMNGMSFKNQHRYGKTKSKSTSLFCVVICKILVQFETSPFSEYHHYRRRGQHLQITFNIKITGQVTVFDV